MFSGPFEALGLGTAEAVVVGSLEAVAVGSLEAEAAGSLAVEIQAEDLPGLQEIPLLELVKADEEASISEQGPLSLLHVRR